MSPSTTSTTLPQELVDAVIDELKCDVGSLRTCSLVSKPWVYRSRKHLFATVNLPTFLVSRWQTSISADPVAPLGPHCHVRSLSLHPAMASAAFGIPETFVGHLSSFTEVSRLAIVSSLWEEWIDAFSDNALVTKYFGGFGKALRSLELTRVYLNSAVLKALLDVFPWLKEILIFSPMVVNEEVKGVEAFPHSRETRSIAETQQSPNVVVPYRQATVRWVDTVTFLFLPKDFIVSLANFPIRCRELVLVEDFDHSGDAFNLFLASTGPTLESLTLRSTFDQGNHFHPVWTSQCLTTIGFSLDSMVTLENCPILRKMTTKAPYTGMPAYISEQVRLVRTVTSPFLGQIFFLGKWDSSHMDGAVDWLEPVMWEMVDRELCDLMGRLDEEVKLEVVFAGVELSGGNEVKGADCERVDGTRTMLLNGVRTRGGVVKIQQAEESRSYF
jgi:hypothetical protein